MEDNRPDGRYDNIDVILINLAYYFVWSANLALTLVDKGFVNIGQERGYIQERARLETAASMLKASVDETYSASKVSQKTFDLLKRAAKNMEKMGEGTDKAIHLIEGAVSQLELFDEFFSVQNSSDFSQLQRDSNEFLAMNILYLYNTYMDSGATERTFRFLERDSGSPVHKYVAQTVRYFMEKSKKM